MKIPSLFILILFACFTLKTEAQEIKFGKVSKQELQEKTYPLDSTAPAAVLYKNRKTQFKYSNEKGFKLITKIRERIKIYDKEGLNWAKKTILTYHSNGSRESLAIKAYTFNLENGKITKNKLKNNSVFEEKLNDYWTNNKFTMPNVKVGSVIELSYTISSPFIWHIEDVICQYKIPLKKIEVKIEIPQYFTFKYLPNFYYPINVIQRRESKMFQFAYKETNTTGGVFVPKSTKLRMSKQNIYQIVYKINEQNIPAINEEPLISNINNYIAKIHFEHTSTQYPNSVPKYYSNNWSDVAKSIFKNPYFGEQLEGTNFLKKDVLNQIKGLKTNQEKALTLFHFIKTQIRWNGIYGKYTDKGIKNAYQEHAGNVADINLCLVAMFRIAGLKADPVLISTKKNGIPLFPTVNGFNYVVASLEINGSLVLFDATEVYSEPNILPIRAINWKGRLVRSDGTSLSVNLFSVKPARERINLFAIIDSTGNIKGLKRSTFYTNYALNYRKSNNALSDKDLLSTLEEKNKGVEISDIKVANKRNIYKPIIESFKFKSDDLCDIIDNKIYFSPLLILADSKNPFTLDKRLYPIDFGTKISDNYNVSITIPKGYTISSIPKNLSIGLPNNMGVFKYIVSKTNNTHLQVLLFYKINSPVIPANQYKILKEFYKQLIEKQTEKVVLTKI